jgi:hypothetical protein
MTATALGLTLNSGLKPILGPFSGKCVYLKYQQGGPLIQLSCNKDLKSPLGNLFYCCQFLNDHTTMVIYWKQTMRKHFPGGPVARRPSLGTNDAGSNPTCADYQYMKCLYGGMSYELKT